MFTELSLATHQKSLISQSYTLLMKLAIFEQPACGNGYLYIYIYICVWSCRERMSTDEGRAIDSAEKEKKGRSSGFGAGGKGGWPLGTRSHKRAGGSGGGVERSESGVKQGKPIVESRAYELQ
jgi:hypothetical protein